MGMGALWFVGLRLPGDYAQRSEPTTCAYCGAKAEWKLLDTGKWRLHNGNTPHTCKQYLERQGGKS